MIEMTLEEDLPEEFRGGKLTINNENKANNASTNSSPVDISDKESIRSSANNNCQWSTGFIAPLSTLPNKITESLWSTKPKEINKQETSVQPCIQINEDANNFFTFREEVIVKAINECISQFLDEETEGPVIGSYLLSQINHWDTEKERLILLTPKTLLIAKYDFIALKRLGCKKLQLNQINYISVGNLVYPNKSLIPRINGLADGVSNIIENCLFSHWSGSEKKPLDNIYQPRDRNIKGVRVVFDNGTPVNFITAWNPFTEDIPYWTFTFHPLYFHKDCTDERQKSLYNLDLFLDKLAVCLEEIKKTNDFCVQQDIILDNYIGVGSLIHNRNALGFFKVRGKFSF